MWPWSALIYGNGGQRRFGMPINGLLSSIYGGVAAAEPVLRVCSRSARRLGLDKLLEARMMDAPVEIWEELSMVKNLVHGYTQKVARYQCSHCGFKARQFYWQCPGCSRWETYPPRRTEELNVMN